MNLFLYINFCNHQKNVLHLNWYSSTGRFHLISFSFALLYPQDNAIYQNAQARAVKRKSKPHTEAYWHFFRYKYKHDSNDETKHRVSQTSRAHVIPLASCQLLLFRKFVRQFHVFHVAAHLL